MKALEGVLATTGEHPPPVPASPSRGRALVVDDNVSNRALLRVLLSREGFKVILAEDGRHGVALFERDGADIVFMDIMMPGMDGYEATTRIKAAAGDQFVPVIFLTALTDQAALAKCIEVGGDDFLTKPYEPAIFKAKIIAAERIRDLYRKIREQHQELSVLHNLMQREQEIAEQIFTAAVTSPNVALSSIRTLLLPAATFNGDLLLTARRPSGELNVLLGDFTGHGLAAAVGALPVSEVFRAMTEKGFVATDILKEIDHKLTTLLPVDMFMAACFLTVDAPHRSVIAWNGGMPEILVVNREGVIRKRLPSVHHPLGISGSPHAGIKVERLEVDADDRILLLSDGVTDARNPAGEMFGKGRLERLIQGCDSGADAFDTIAGALEKFCQGRVHDDDITFVEIPCRADLAVALQKEEPSVSQPNAENIACIWRWSLELHGAGLRSIDSVPLAIAQLQELHSLSTHRETLYIVLSELFSNALDHGVLRLNSSLKTSEEGFSRYYAEREKRLAALNEGYVRIELAHLPQGEGGRLTIRVEDSGEGFDFAAALAGPQLALENNSAYAGRGLSLVSALCESLRYQGQGNCVEAVYAWAETKNAVKSSF